MKYRLSTVIAVGLFVLASACGSEVPNGSDGPETPDPSASPSSTVGPTASPTTGPTTGPTGAPGPHPLRDPIANSISSETSLSQPQAECLADAIVNSGISDEGLQALADQDDDYEPSDEDLDLLIEVFMSAPDDCGIDPDELF